MSITKPIRHPGLVDRLVEHVFAAILEGKLKQGSELTEEQIATDFGVSRTPVREAIRRLAEMGVIVVRPRCGLEIAAFDEQDHIEITTLRVELECLALRLAIDRMGQDEIDSLKKAVDQCESKVKSQDRIEIFLSDSRFHLMIADYSGNRHLADTLRRLDVKVQLCRMVYCASMPKIRESVKSHRPLLEAITKRNVTKAEKLLRDHITQFLLGSHSKSK